MKDNLRKKVVMGICTAAFLSQQVIALAATAPPSSVQVPMTKDEQIFARKLSGAAKDLFNQMSHATRSIAMSIVLHNCKGQNACKGQGLGPNGGLGQNACKGQGTCRITAADAVNIAAAKNSAAAKNTLAVKRRGV